MTRWKKTISSIGALLLVVALLTSCTGPIPSVALPPALSEKKEVTSEDLLLVDQLLLAGKYEDAVLQLQKLGQIEPSNSAVQDKLATATAEWKFTEAQTLVAVGAYAEAIKKMKTALDVLPNDKRILTAMDEAYLNLGKKYLELLDTARAKEALLAVNYDQNLRLQAQGLMNLDVQAVDNTQKGYQALQAGDYTMAMSYFRAALQLKPDLAQAQSGMKATETMIVVRPTSFPQTFVQPAYQQPYIPPSGTEPPATTQPTESNSWEKPDSSGAGTSDWGQFKQWMESEINGNQMSGNAINENPLLDFENLAKIEDPQAYNYLAESDFANSLYLTAIKIYGERALYIASEIPRIFPLPNSLDPNYQTAQQRIQRLSKATRFVEDGISGLKPPTIFKATQKNLQALIDNELAILTSFSYAGFLAPPEVGQLSDQSQAYVDEFDLAQAKVLMVPFSQLPAWAQVKRYYIEASLNAYMLNEIASDFENLLPLPQVYETGRPIYSPASTLSGISVQLKSSNGNPKPGDNVTITLLAYNSSTTTIGASITAALPPNTTMVDQGAGVYRIDNGQPVIVWENIQLPPVTSTGTQATTTGTGVTTIARDFTLRIEPEALNQDLTFKVWLTGFTTSILDLLQSASPYNASGPISANISVYPSNPNPGTTVTFDVNVTNGGKDSVMVDVTVPIPFGTTLVDMGQPIGQLTTLAGQAIKWTGQTLTPSASAHFRFTVQLPLNASAGSAISTYAVIQASVSGQAQSGGSNPVVLPWVYFADLLRVAVSADKGTVAPNGSVTVTTTVENITWLKWEQVTVVMPLPTNATLLNYTGSPAQMIIQGQKSLVWPYGPIGPHGIGLSGNSPGLVDKNPSIWGVSATFQAPSAGAVTVSPYAFYHQTSSPTLTLTLPGAPSVSQPGIVSLDLSADSNSPNPGDTVTYDALLTNATGSTQYFSLRISMPTNSLLVDSGGAITGNYFDGLNDVQSLIWPVQAIPPNSSVTISFQAQVLATGTIVSNAYLDLGTIIPAGALSVPVSASGSFGSQYSFNTSSIFAIVIVEALPEQIISPISVLKLLVGTGAAPGHRGVLDETIRLVRYSENLHWNLTTTRTPSALDVVSTGNLVRAANELSSALYWIPIKWAQLSQLPYEYYVGYPAYSSGLGDLPNAASLFDPVTGVVVKNPDSYLTISADLTAQFGTPESWKDMIEFLRAQLLQRLAELGYR